MDFAAARRAMVDGQIRTNDVTDRALIAAMLDVPREQFVPEQMGPLAYLDRDLPLEGAGPSGTKGRQLIKPAVFARLVQAADPGPRDHVLVVGCGCGYSAAVLARLAGSVVALDDVFAEKARAAISAMGVTNVTVVAGSLAAGWAANAPYDIVLVEGGVEAVPDGLFAQLAPTGRLVTVIMAGPIGKATYFQRIGGEVSGRSIFDATEPMLPGFSKTPAFVF
jgi:protein-L-isoaspartate(D-aspartate) O-methyltransferase